MAAKLPEFINHCCEICGEEGLNDDEMREHVMVCHVKNAASCPYCDLSNVSECELFTHVNTAHLDYLTPEREMMAFIDEDEISINDDPTVIHTVNNNNNNNVEFFEDKLEIKRTNGESWGSPQRSQLALNLRSTTVSLKCPLCSFSVENPAHMEQHINRQHFDLTSPSVPTGTPSRSSSAANYSCPLCIRTFENTPDLELHVNIEHKDILSPAKPIQDGIIPDKTISSCPICCLANFKSTDELAHHIEDHFNQKGLSPLTPDISGDRLLAKEIEKKDKEVQRLREQHEFQLLRAQYGMDNEGNFKEQSLSAMQRAVYSGELSVADYYERQIELKMAESTGIDDNSSVTRDIVALLSGISRSNPEVGRIHTCSTVDHYASTYGDKGWGCGYRNMQMLLSSLFHHTGYNECLYKQWTLVKNAPLLTKSSQSSGRSLQQPSCGTLSSASAVCKTVSEPLPPRSAMPSISRLQACVEWAWSQGFDTQGCEQLGGVLCNTRKWIGATEVVTVLSALRIRCQLVDFHCPSSANGEHPDLFKWVLHYFTSYNDFKPPLYLQHQGHSRTIVGVEETREGGITLLVLDPSHSSQQMGDLRCTLTASNAMRLVRKTSSSMRAKQYQIVAVVGTMESEQEYQRSKVLRSERIPPDR